jgi:YHS domain-containing protein
MADSATRQRFCKVLTSPTTYPGMKIKNLVLILTLVTLAIPVFAQNTKVLVNVDDKGLALQGYDPVAFFTQDMPVKGDKQFSSTHDNGTYYFASADDKKTFDADPEKYEPSFGGYCAYGVVRKKLVEIDVDAFQIVDNRLLLQYSKGVREKFNKDQTGNLAKADANWPALVDKNGH